MSLDKQAFVLHRRPYRETSFLIELFTRESGRISVIAKGAKRAKSSFSYILEPFVLLSADWSGKGGLSTLKQAEVLGQAYHLKGKNLFSGFYINELLMHLMHQHDPHPEVFHHYIHLLDQLNQLHSEDSRALEMTLRTFERKLLDDLGYGFQFDIEENQSYRFIPGDGFYKIENSRDGARPVSEIGLLREGEIKKNVGVGCDPSLVDPGSGSRMTSLRESRMTIKEKPVETRFISSPFSGKNLLAISQDDYSSDLVLKDAKRLMRTMFDYLLEGREIKSRQLFV